MQRRGTGALVVLGMLVLAMLCLGGSRGLSAPRPMPMANAHAARERAARARDESLWVHLRDLNAPPTTLPLGLGAAVSASCEGTLAVGCGRDRDTGEDAGVVTLWRCDGQWNATGGGGGRGGGSGGSDNRSLVGMIPHPKGSRFSAFGGAVAIDPSGSLLCVGAPNEEGSLGWPEGFQVGRVYLYRLSTIAQAKGGGSCGAGGGSNGNDSGGRIEWSLEAVLDPPGAEGGGGTGGHFGASIATDGVRVAVGSPDFCSPGDPALGFATGRVDVFVRTAGAWRHESHLPSPTGQVSGRFGRSVALDGRRLLVGWPGARGSFTAQGRADLFTLGSERGGTPPGGPWLHTALLLSPAQCQGGMLGASVALDGDLIAVGAPGERLDDAQPAHSGAVHLWKIDGAPGGRVRLVASIGPPESPCHDPPDAPDAPGAPGQRPEAFGMSLAMRDGLLAVGATEACAVRDSRGGAGQVEGSGCVHLIGLDALGSWRALARLQSPEPLPEVHDGWSVAVGIAGSAARDRVRPIDGRSTLAAGALPWIAAARLGDPDLPPGPGRVLIFAPGDTHE